MPRAARAPASASALHRTAQPRPLAPPPAGGGAWGRGRLRRRAASRVPSLRSRPLARSLARPPARSRPPAPGRPLARWLAVRPPPPGPLRAVLGSAVRSGYSQPRAAIGCHRMCLSKQNYFSSSPSPHPRRRPSRTSVEESGPLARLPRTPRATVWAPREPRRRPGCTFACMQISLKIQTS